MPGPIPTGTSRAFALTVQGVNFTGLVPAESVTLTEAAGNSNSVLEFDFEYATGSGANFTWMGKLSHDVILQDLTNARRLFHGNLVNTRRSHQPGRRVLVHCTALGYDAWLDRLVVPSWTSKRPNNTNMATDREQIQSITAAVAAGRVGLFGAWDAINTYVASTNAAMPVVKMLNGGTARDLMNAVAEAAASYADPTARRFYVDADNHLHYFKGSESLTAPYRLGDASYTTTVKGTSGIVSLVQFNESTGTPTDPYGVATVTLNGGYTQNAASMVPNEPVHRSITFNGTTGYASLAGAALHAVDGPWSVGIWFKRGATIGTAQTLVSAGTNDYYIGFDATNHLIVQKEGTGDNFVSTPTYTDTNAHHLVITRAVGTTTMYVDGAVVAGATTARTFASAAGAVNIGRKLSTTNLFFTGTVQAFQFYSATLSAATVLAHYQDGWTLVPDDFEFETDVNDSGTAVYVRGTSNSGWVYDAGNSNYNQTQIIDRQQVTSAALRDAVGRGYLKSQMPVVYSGRAVITMAASTWRPGQTITIDDASLGIDGTDTKIGQTYEIRQLNTYPNMGSGVVTYEIYFGALPWSGTFDVQRKKRR